MSIWLVRAGRRGEREEVALSNNVVTIYSESIAGSKRFIFHNPSVGPRRHLRGNIQML